MHKKIVILFVIMLMMLPISSVAEKISKSTETNSALDDDLPNWQEGDYWKYDLEFEGELGDAMDYSWAFSDVIFEVEDSLQSSYSMSVSGGVTGEMTLFELQIVSGTLQSTTITGTASVDKSNNGIEEIDALISGKIAVSGIPLKSFTMDVDLTFDPPFSSVDFPISVGKTWTIPISDVSGTVDVSILNNPIIVDDIVGGDRAECIGAKTVSVAAGSFSAYEITTDGDAETFYYAADAGNVIQATGSGGNFVGIELKDTNYGLTPGAPNTPSTPSGPSSGSSGTRYTYTTSTTDNEGNQVYYWFDWGDGSNSGWLGPYASGASCQAEKTWNRRGNFAVKVKAKDTEDHESRWSGSLSVSMPRNRASALRRNVFEAEMGIRGEEDSKVSLDGTYNGRGRFVVFSGTATTMDGQQGSFRGFFRNDFFVIRRAIGSRTILIFGSLTFDENHKTFEGDWRIRWSRISGWIQGSLS